MRQHQVGGVDAFAVAHGHGAFQDVFQFAHVAGEIVGFQRLFRFGGQLPDATAVLAGQCLQDEPGQLRHVAATLAQRWHAQLDHVDAIEQILAELALLNQLAEVLVGGREDAHVHRNLVATADGAYRLLLDRAQQFHLHVQRQFGHFVEEQRAALGGLEQAFLVGAGTGEAALAMTEELAFHQLGRNRAAVDRHERAARTRALLVDQAGHQLLAHAGFTGDVDRCLVAGELADGGTHLLHRGRVADQAFAGAAGLDCTATIALFLGQPQGGTHQATQHLDVDRLGNEIERAGLQRVHRGVDIAVRGDHRDRSIRAGLGDQFDDFLAVAIGQAHVGEAQVVAALGQCATRLGHGAHGFDLQVHPTQGDGQQLADVAFVIDDQDGLWVHGTARGC